MMLCRPKNTNIDRGLVENFPKLKIANNGPFFFFFVSMFRQTDGRTTLKQ